MWTVWQNIAENGHVRASIYRICSVLKLFDSNSCRPLRATTSIQKVMNTTSVQLLFLHPGTCAKRRTVTYPYARFWIRSEFKSKLIARGPWSAAQTFCPANPPMVCKHPNVSGRQRSVYIRPMRFVRPGGIDRISRRPSADYTHAPIAHNANGYSFKKQNPKILRIDSFTGRFEWSDAIVVDRRRPAYNTNVF